jgi:hypothetical protein
MQYNVCKTCGAKDGRAGLLLNWECLNCHDTRKSGDIVIHTHLSRTEEELKKTFAILDEKKEDIQETP